ncbi:aspartate/glutamate racemase family protein [Bacillus sp. V3B]|uniref:aspartate/glutamate racemase family protein n=1 Tax=Bacillus sp. V3B TaxID=2804915 RepID=UPI00210E9250|nr:amino acid racemase [Bacillus sp. V3B]MCQ6276688.1 aspartate/glutamate racemase family protein [Bacillus sp. V3B]
MESKGLGIIGGMGPKATSVFFDSIVENTDAKKDQDHINMVILNHATLPDRTDAILNGKDELFLDSIRNDIELLEKAGVSNIAIPCNTSHYFYDKIQGMTDINIINMVEETIKEIYERYGKNAKIGVMATNGTIKSDVYKKVCQQYGLQLYYPDTIIQEQVMDIIYNKVKSDLKVDSNEIKDIVFDFIFKHECSCVILACTELSCINLNDDVAKYCVDAMKVLVKKSIELSGKHMENHTLDEFLSESFANDQFVRELRLSKEELEYAKKKYPNASFKIISTEEDRNEKCWCEINLLPLSNVEKTLLEENEVEDREQRKQKLEV